MSDGVFIPRFAVWICQRRRVLARLFRFYIHKPVSPDEINLEIYNINIWYVFRVKVLHGSNASMKMIMMC